MIYFELLWVCFLIIYVDKKIASFIRIRLKTDRFFRVSNGGIYVGIGLAFLTIHSLAFILSAVFGETLYTDHLSEFIFSTVLGLVGGTVGRVCLRV